MSPWVYGEIHGACGVSPVLLSYLFLSYFFLSCLPLSDLFLSFFLTSFLFLSSHRFLSFSRIFLANRRLLFRMCLCLRVPPSISQ
ncbi:hypothetical protein CSUI_003777 [Cystoisospora suis]|uniref:Transmembrane protein n=1 Tax=Cystoisospora suis TaxID=483139 RepID=A0A2C6L4A3_9APIC|nr:hypothetical protein CSUI_003777 [Cystoisospora suis]